MVDDLRDIEAALRGMEFLKAGEKITIERLDGGVSCDVYRADIGSRQFCVKRALTKLRVDADWRAPVERSHTEVEWLQLAGEVDPRLVPDVLGEDRKRHLFVMPFYPPEQYPVWKAQLAHGVVDPAFATSVGAALARIHAATAERDDVAYRFSNGTQFLALRLEPYLLYAAQKHPDVASRIRAIANDVAKSRIALMHGDFSPKNILCGPDGPMILDAETACYGDPAFDLAFCLNHLLLKCVWHPEHREAYLQSFAQLKEAYLSGVSWEQFEAVDARAAPLLGAFLLARIDGKSPVEYLTREKDKAFVRNAALGFIKSDHLTLGEMAILWREKLDGAKR